MWKKVNLFERKCDVFSYSKQALQRSDSQIHIFIPWSSHEINDLMFRLKKIVISKGSGFIPLINLDGSVVDLSEQVYESLRRQLEKGVETHLYMSNLESIHVWRVKSVLGKNSKS